VHWDYHGLDETGSNQALVLLPCKAGSRGVAGGGGDFTLYTFSNLSHIFNKKKGRSGVLEKMIRDKTRNKNETEDKRKKKRQ